jgi:hypothetical protein
MILNIEIILRDVMALVFIEDLIVHWYGMTKIVLAKTSMGI